MIAERLRKAILQAVIQGKLTEQLPEDGDARDLLREIRQEKNSLIKEGKLKKNKPLPEITEDEIPFDIPENWVWCRLGTISYNHGQKKPDKKFTYIDISSINNRHNKLGQLDSILNPQEAPSRARKIVHYGDVIYATVRPYLHNICIINKEITPEPIVSTGFAVVCTPELILNEYLFHCFLSPMFDSYANDSDNARGVAYPAINDDKFCKALIPLPPLSEQKRIIEQLKKLLLEIDKLKADETKLDELQKTFPKKMKDSILQYAIQGKLTDQLPEDGNARDLLKEIQKDKARLIKEGKIKKEKPLPEMVDEEIPFEIPRNWCWVRLGNVISLKSGQDLTPSKYQSIRGGIPYITGASNFSFGTINIERWTLEPQSIAYNGDLLITCKGTIGEMAFLNEEKAHIARQVMAITSSDVVELAYVKLFLDWYIVELKSMAKSLIPGISREMVLNSLFPLPPLSEQKRIVEKIEKLLPLCETLE